ncbi:hypothetical protein LUZ60_012562 [Juncus effusus]|nr:hypothetical protein LUZ60_012562 [Juncus effusus]
MLIMDAIEMPLHTSAINPKAVLPNLSSRVVGSSEIRVSDSADPSISLRNRDSASTSSRTDTKFLAPPNPHKKPDFPIPPKSGTSNPVSKPDSVSRRTFNGESTGMILSLPKQDASKTLNPKRSVKLINILPPPNSSNKRPKVEQGLETPVSADSEESARSLKRRRERGERKAVRGGNVRAKCELVNSDSALGGSSILGMYGLKIDPHDITKNTEDPTLKDLLEGSRTFYRHSSTSRDNKGKKSVCSKEELILSIRKAHSLLPVRTENKKDNNINKECDGDKIKCCDKPPLLCKNSSQMNPKEVLDRLSLNQDQNLNSVLISNNSNPLPALNATSLPPFNWSTPPQSGAHKPSFDSVRLPWVRIGGNFTSCTEKQQESDEKSGCALLDYLEKLEKEDGKLKDLNCDKKEESSRRGEMSHETASVSGQTIEASKQGNDYSARVVQAAEILCEISRCSNLQTTNQKQTNGAIKWPNSPSLKTMKPSKPLPPFIKHENNTNTTTTTTTNNNVSNPFPSRNLDYSPSRSLSSHSHQSSKQHKLPTTVDRKKLDNNNNNNNNHNNNNNSARGSIKWPIPTFPTDPKQQLSKGNDKRPQNSNNYSSQARLERDYENQQRIRKATLTALSGNPNPGNPNPGNSNPGNSNPRNSNLGNSGPWDWKRNKRG